MSVRFVIMAREFEMEASVGSLFIKLLSWELFWSRESGLVIS